MKHGRQENAMEQFKESQQVRRTKGDLMVERWLRTDIGEKLDTLYMSNPQHARNVAWAIQMQEAHLKTLNETIIATTFSTRPENLLKVVRIGTANSNRGNFATEYPLETTDDAIFYVHMTYEQTLRGATANEKIYEKINPYYAGEQVVATIDAAGSGTSYSITVSTSKPVVPYSVRVLVGGALVGNDDGSGNLVYTGYNSGSANTINYTSGAVVMNFLAAPNAKIEILYNWNSEDSNLYSQLGTVGISLEKRRFNARPMPLGYSYSTMTEIMLNSTGLGNAEELLIKAVGDEHAKSRDYKAIARMRQIALGNATATFDADFAAAGEVSAKSHAQMLTKTIGNVSAVIYDDIKRGMINKAIGGSKAVEYCRLHDGWKEDTTQPRTGVYKAGSLNDIEVYGCPADSALVANNEMLLSYKNPEEGMDIAIAFGVLTEITAALKYPQFYTVGNVATVEDAITFNTKFIRLLQITNL